jgi:hypothetical protein
MKQDHMSARKNNLNLPRGFLRKNPEAKKHNSQNTTSIERTRTAPQVNE